MIQLKPNEYVCPYCYETFTAASFEGHCDERDCREQHIRRVTREQIHPAGGSRRGVDWAVPART